MRLFNKVAIVGVGLIGGSIGLAIKKRKLAGEVLGISRRSKTIKAGLKRGAIDRGFFDLSIASEADLVVLAAPVNSIINTGRKLSAVIKPGALVVDTGSSKKEIVAALAKILPGFVGAHPLAGSEKQGVINAHADLFKGSLCILTPTDKTRKHALTKIRRFWVQLGASVICLSPSRHDKLVSCISHLPHLVAFSLIHSIPRRNLFLAASGFRDTTRIALSDAGLWKDIFLTNSHNLLDALKKFKASLSRIQSAIAKNDPKALEKILNQARLKRASLNKK